MRKKEIDMAWSSDSQRKKTHQCWSDMKQRCFNQKNASFHRYGGRGITVCDRWKDSFTAFLEDMGDKPDGMSLDRINNDGNYSPENCRWATPAIQINNRSCTVIIEFNGKKMTATEWADHLNLSLNTISGRLRRGFPVEQVLAVKYTRRILRESRNSSGYIGVSQRSGKWRAQISRNNKYEHLGTFDTPEEASAAYQSAVAGVGLHSATGYKRDERAKHEKTNAAVRRKAGL